MINTEPVGPPPTRKPSTFARIKRIYSPLNILLLVGNILRKRALRSLSLAAIGVFTILWRTSDQFIDQLGNFTQLPLDTVLPHLEAAALGLGLLFPAGLAVSGGYNFIAARHERKARLNTLILTGDYKKLQLSRAYLTELWDEVYGHERRLHPDSSLPQQREAFIELAQQGLNTPQPQTIQEQQLGFPLLLLESWCRRGLFTAADHLGDMLEYHQSLRDIRQLQHTALRRHFWLLFRAEPGPSFWHALTMRKMQLLIGREQMKLNRQYQQEGSNRFFRSEQFVWPSADMEAVIATAHGDAPTLQDLKTARRSIYHKVFSDNWFIANEHVYWLFRKDYRQAYIRRLRFDPEFVMGRIGCAQSERDQVKAVFDDILCLQMTLNRYRHVAGQSRALLTQWLQQQQWHHISGADYRTLWLAIYINHRGLRRRLKSGKRPEKTSALLKAVVLEEQRFSRGLRKVREIHTLSHFQIRTYQQVVWQLGEYSQTEQQPSTPEPAEALRFDEQAPAWQPAMHIG